MKEAGRRERPTALVEHTSMTHDNADTESGIAIKKSGSVDLYDLTVTIDERERELIESSDDPEQFIRQAIRLWAITSNRDEVTPITDGELQELQAV